MDSVKSGLPLHVDNKHQIYYLDSRAQIFAAFLKLDCKAGCSVLKNFDVLLVLAQFKFESLQSWFVSFQNLISFP